MVKPICPALLAMHLLLLPHYLATVKAGVVQISARWQPGWCRNQPGDPGFPSASDWQTLNSEVGGRLVPVVPSAKFCHSLPAGNCTENEWLSTKFRGTIPGAMESPNWEQDYLSNPPSLCLQNGTTCAQGNVPLYAVNVTTSADIQAAVRFAARTNIRLAVKASGHDLLGRSTAKNALLIWTYYLKNISFTDAFHVGEKNLGSVVTVGSGVPLNALFLAAKAQNKTVVGGTAADVAVAGGYVQGGGHSPFSPLLGLASDNALQFTIVVANGSLVIANELEHSDLFWALRGGGAGSWGVIVSATFRTYPIFQATLHLVAFSAPTNASTAQIVGVYARHIFDLDAHRAGQYFYVFPGLSPTQPGANIFSLMSYIPNVTTVQAGALLKPFVDDVKAAGFPSLIETSSTATANEIAYSPDDQAGTNLILGSRLIPPAVFKNNISAIEDAYVRLLELGPTSILGHVVAGGQVSDNANISSAVNPKWRTAKAHVLASCAWSDSTPAPFVELIKETFTKKVVPILANLTQETDSGAYSNEADVREPNFQTTFYGPNYHRLKQIKRKYDPHDLFLVQTGVGSERWDSYGLCRV